MKVAILGAGYCGLALAWHMAGASQVSLFDPEKLGKTSRASTGLLHPFLGGRPRLSWQGLEALEETKAFLHKMQQKTSLCLFRKTGIYKPLLHARQTVDFRKAVDRYTQVEWIDSFQEIFHYHLIENLSGIFIPDGYCVFSQNYLQILHESCLEKGVKRVYQKIDSLDALQEFDQVILATGAMSHQVNELKDVPFDRVKGQALVCTWPENTPSLPMSIIGQAHICMSQDQKTCIIGSTYEHQFTGEEPTEEALELLDRIAVFFPLAKQLKVQKVQAGVRMHRKDSHLPLVMRLSEKLWVFTAVGSRGLLYHQLLARLLAEAIYTNEEDLLPTDVQIKSLMV